MNLLLVMHRLSSTARFHRNVTVSDTKVIIVFLSISLNVYGLLFHDDIQNLRYA